MTTNHLSMAKLFSNIHPSIIYTHLYLQQSLDDNLTTQVQMCVKADMWK